jgi:UPF0755 protein
MIDELELAFDERMEKGRHRRGARRKPRSGGAKTFTAFLVVILLLGGLAGGAWYGFDRIKGLFSAADYEGAGTAEKVTIEVKNGDTISDMANTLVKADVVKSAGAFVDAAKENSRSENIQYGFYTLNKQQSAQSALAVLLDPKNKVTRNITIPEGLSAVQTFKRLSDQTKIPVAQFQAAAKDPIALGVPDWWYKRLDKKKATVSVEGFLYPDTYELGPAPTAEEILKTMVGRFLTVTGNELKFADTVQGGLSISPYEALIVASLAQAEAGVPGDLGKVARVAYNRVYKEGFPCGCLEMDVTVNYWLEVNGKQTKKSSEMSAAELDDPKNPYNRKIKGLPPSPINNPGKVALQGAMNPPSGRWLFFVAIDKKGNSAFAETAAEHDRNVDKAKAAGVL